ncbi:MAG: beta-ketoacyl synthase N-terminal-like domain-containing protein [Crocinitomicaceae bacterium]|nr:beta-ketoacyl synthase N-terminal-like domain-containing protein [Crocinitomicaceae bacterium]
MSQIYLSYGGLITPLGTTVSENFANMREGKSGVQKIKGSGFNKEDWPLGKMETLTSNNRYRELLNLTCEKLIEQNGEQLFSDPRTLIILSSTKADITDLPNDTFASTRQILNERLNPASAPVIISNACISGVLAINTASDYINAGKYDTVVVIGIDVLTDFIIYGFQSLFALSAEPSQPFDKNRKGICIGEASGTIIVSKHKPENLFHVEYLGGSSSNDANHISGPSRTGEGLYRSVNKTLQRSGINSFDIDFISAHGTGTLFNDEMESIAFDRLGLNNVPMNSLKGYFGHTLGAAGVIEIISTMLMMEHGLLLRSIGFEETGTSKQINVLKENIQKNTKVALKTASGFGGGNASLIIKKSV